MDKTIIGIYKDFTTACEVVRDLTESGFARNQIELVACPNTALNLLPHPMRQYTRLGGGVGVLLGGVAGLVLALMHENTFAFYLATLATSLALSPRSPLASAAASPLSPSHSPAPLEFWLTVGLSVVIAGLTGMFAVMGYAARNPQGGSQLTLKTEAELLPCATQIMQRYSPLHLEPFPGEGASRVPILTEKPCLSPVAPENLDLIGVTSPSRPSRSRRMLSGVSAENNYSGD